MLPVQVEFPKFVADQLLTSDNLNQLFGYLDEQNRITRTNLIGIGIVCGLQLQVNNAKTSVTITKGCGVTSEGYLISVNTQTYTQYKPYKVDTPKVYSKFYKTDSNGNTVPMQVWELKQAAVEPDLQPISETFLTDKVVLLFVELKEEDNKNCDPNSCDDKGINVTVSFLPMVVTKDDAALLIGATGGSFGINTYTSLPELRMKRWDVPNTNPVDTRDIFEAYLKLLDKNFMDDVEAKLKNIYTVFGTIVASDYTTNPFTGLSAKFEFLYNGTASLNQLLHVQYFYDLFSDLLLAYQEFRTTGTHILSTCCPDSDLFPRHLLLGEALPSVTTGVLPYRHYFIYSPLFDQQNRVAELKLLFHRLVLLVSQFYLPTVDGNNFKEDPFLRITPSKLWDVPLSQKAIPYYYHVNSGTQPLYLNWNYRRTLLNDASRTLSYHSKLYNASDEFVREPLNYDLEPYNFLRIEGVLGKSYTHVLNQVKKQISQNRLPVDIIALSTDSGVKLSGNILNSLRGITDSGEMLCYFQDLESMYDSLRREILCTLCKELRYYFDFTFNFLNSFIPKNANTANQASQVRLFRACGPEYIIKERSLGIMIEFLYRKGFTDENLTLESFFNAFGINVVDNDNDDIPDGLKGQAAVIYLALLNFFKIPLGIIRLASLLTEDLAELDVRAYCKATEMLGEYAKSIKSLFSILTGSSKSDTANTVNEGAAVPATTGTVTNAATGTGTTTGTSTVNRINVNSGNAFLASVGGSSNAILRLVAALLILEDLLDHLDKLIYNCKCSALLSLKKDYMKRYVMLSKLRMFGYYTRLHPGIQHKAGVPMGGTFIIVYHSRQRRRESGGFFNERRMFMNAEMKTYSRTYTESDAEDAVFFAGNNMRNQQVNIAGVVTDENSNAVAGASVTIQETGQSTVTNADGRFQMIGSVVPYTLLVEAVGYEEAEIAKTDDDDNILVQLKAVTGDIFRELREGTVIADFYLPYRCCSDCPPIQYIVREEKVVETPHTGPVVNAGADIEIVLPVNTVALKGSASAAAGSSIKFYQWSRKTGTGAFAFATPNSAETSVTDLEEGVYEFELSVTDDKDAVAKDDVKVTVKPKAPEPGQPPVADAGKDDQIPISFVTATRYILDGRGSKDPDGVIKEYIWTQVDGPTATIDGASTQQPVVTFFKEGAHKFRLEVIDADGLRDDATVTITVLPPPNQPPVARAGENRTETVSPNDPRFILNGSASSDPEGSALTYLWKFEGGAGDASIQDEKAVQTFVTVNKPGEYKFSLKVADDKNAEGATSVLINVVFKERTDIRNCGSLSEIIALLGKAESTAGAPLLRKFRTVFAPYEEIRAYFKKMSTVAAGDAEKHFQFFSEGVNGADIQEQLIKWLNALHEFIINPDRKEFRLLALMIYRVLLQLVMYIVCIQKEDMMLATIKTDQLFDVVVGHVKRWITIHRRQGFFEGEELSFMESMVALLTEEIQKVKANGEEVTKEKYVSVLKTLIEMFAMIR
jgi:hypothetical protein